MKITFLGTNGWYDTRTGNTICTLIGASSYFVVVQNLVVVGNILGSSLRLDFRGSFS